MTKSRLLPLLACVFLAATGLFFLWRTLDSETDISPSLGDERATTNTNAPTTSADTPSALETPDSPADTSRQSTPSLVAAHPATTSAQSENFPLDSARWIEGTLRFPSGSPADETLQVWAVSGDADAAKPPRDARNPRPGPVANPADGGALIASLQADDENRTWSHRPVDASGAFRVPCAKDASTARLVVDGRYLYLDEPRKFDIGSELGALTLEPKLGCWLVARCTAPIAATPEDSPAGAKAQLYGFSMSSSPRRIERSFIRRETRVAGDLTLDFRGLPPEPRYRMSVSPSRLAIWATTEIATEAGRRTDLDIVLEFGARVSGRVVDESSGPIAGAEVSGSGRVAGRGMGMMMGGMGGADDRSAATEKDGSFELFGLANGKVKIQAAHEGFADGHSSELALKEGQSVTGIEIVMSHGNALAGTVAWPDGKPARDATVTAAEVQTGNRGFRWAKDSHQARTDDQGRFAISGLGEGPFSVSASARPPRAANEPPADARKSPDETDEVLTALGYAGADAADENDAKKGIEWTAMLENQVKNDREVKLVLHSPPGVSGKVVDDTGAPVLAFKISADPDWNGGNVTGNTRVPAKDFTTKDGAFFLPGVPDGKWSISASAIGHASAADAPVVSVPSKDELVITLSRAGSASGIVLDTGGKPVAGATVSRSAQGARNPFQLMGDEASTETSQSGAFTLDSLPGGSWQLSATHDGFARSEPVAVEIVPAQTVDNVVITLRMGGTLEGEVFGARGEHAVGRNVQIFSMSGDMRSSKVDSGGQFKEAHVTPGTYQVLLEPAAKDIAGLTGGDDGQPDIGDILSKMKMTSCEIKDGETTRVVLGAPPKAPVRVFGTITQGGQPLAKCTLIVLNEGGAMLQNMKFGKVDASGHYEITLDKPGDIVFMVSKGLGSNKGVEFYLSIPETAEFQADLSLPLSAIRGRLRGPDGAPLANFSVQLQRGDGAAGILTMDGPPNTQTDADGRFEFKDLNPGTYAVAAGGTSGGRFGGDGDADYGRVVRGGLKIEADKVIDGIELELSAPGRIEGLLRDASGNSVSGATVYVRDAKGELVHPFSGVSSDASGKFAYKGLSPGVYTMSSRTKTLAARESPAVSVHEGGASACDLVLEPGTTLRVSIVDDHEKPLRAQISVKDERGLELGGMINFDAMERMMTQGVSSTERWIGPLPGGKYVVTATLPDGKQVKKPVTLKGQDERKLVLRAD